MISIDTQYQNLIRDILEEGKFKNDRTGIGSYTVFGREIRHKMRFGFPALTVRKVPLKSSRVELEGFIKGINSKKWYQERGCRYWDQWANPQKVPYGTDEETKAKMFAEDDLGIIYGNNWRDFHSPYSRKLGEIVECDGIIDEGVDQLANLVKELKTNPESRRMVVYGGNPLANDYCALPACHDRWQVNVTGDRLNLLWSQRSVDVVLGLPSNITFYATLLHLLALEGGFMEGELIGHLGDCHIYTNAEHAAEEYAKREEFDYFPRIKTENFTNIFDWTYDQTVITGYQAHDRIKVEVAV